MPHKLPVTAETSQDPIGPCGPLEQSEDSLRHSAMATWISDLDCGAHPVAGCFFNSYTVVVRRVVTRTTRLSSWLELEGLKLHGDWQNIQGQGQ